jgi:hypothetical protein
MKDLILETEKRGYNFRLQKIEQDLSHKRKMAFGIQQVVVNQFNFSLVRTLISLIQRCSACSNAG